MKGAILNLIMGIWLMTVPALLGYGKPASINDYIIGPLVASFSIIAFSEVTRTVNKWNLLFGSWLILVPWILSFNETVVVINNILSGGLIIIFSLMKKNVKKSFGGGWTSVWKK